MRSAVVPSPTKETMAILTLLALPSEALKLVSCFHLRFRHFYGWEDHFFSYLRSGLGLYCDAHSNDHGYIDTHTVVVRKDYLRS